MMNEGYREIPLSQGKFALVDAEDYERISQWKWYADLSHRKSFYAVRKSARNGGPQKIIMMHREIMGLSIYDPRRVDHRDPAGTLDNRRSNLRFATPAEQACNRRSFKNNRCRFKGVSPSGTGRWTARIGHNRKVIYLGTFDTPEAAHSAYCDAAKRLHGEFARFS